MTSVSSQETEPKHDFLAYARSLVARTIGQDLLCARGTARSEMRSGVAADSVSPFLESNRFPSVTLHSVIEAVMRRQSIRSTVRLTGVPQKSSQSDHHAGACGLFACHHAKCQLRRLQCSDLRCRVISWRLGKRTADRRPKVKRNRLGCGPASMQKPALFRCGSSLHAKLKQRMPSSGNCAHWDQNAFKSPLRIGGFADRIRVVKQVSI